MKLVISLFNLKTKKIIKNNNWKLQVWVKLSLQSKKSSPTDDEDLFTIGTLIPETWQVQPELVRQKWI